VAIPGDPSVNDMIVAGMREGGQFTITNGSSAYTDFYTYQFPTIKTEIWNACRTDRLIEQDTCLICPVGQSQVTLPTDFDSEVDLWVYDASAPFRGTAQSGAGSTITLASDFTAQDTDLFGRYIFIISGTGSGQFRQIIGYNDTTKVLTPDSSWTTTPDNTSQYLIQVYRVRLKRIDYLRPIIPSRRPVYYKVNGPAMLIYPAGDQIYPVLMTYRPNLTRLDEASSLFVKHMRERRHLWIQGIKVRTMARYDDERYMAEKQIWEQMLLQYARQNVVYSQMEVNR